MSRNKSHDLNQPPNWLLNEYVDQLLTLLTVIINKAMAELMMPFCSK